jgi:single-strand DNA-binding protein
MRDVNVVVLVGRLSHDSELKYTKAGQPVARFSIAVNRSVKRGEEWFDEASFFEVDFWGKAGESINRYLIKGQQVAVEGELRQDRWEQDGQSRSKIIIVASNVRLVGGSPGQSRGASTAQRPRENNSKPQQQKPDDNFGDDIPF